jgi:hypothetical protein
VDFFFGIIFPRRLVEPRGGFPMTASARPGGGLVIRTAGMAMGYCRQEFATNCRECRESHEQTNNEFSIKNPSEMLTD